MKGTVATIGSNGSAGGQLIYPKGIAVHEASGDIYVADSGNNRISVFDSSGNFERVFGWDVNATEPGTDFEICTAASGDTCQAGVPGEAGGQLWDPMGLALDQSKEAVFVVDYGNARVQKFDLEGNFLLAFGYNVNQTTGGDICTAVSGHVCQAGVPGAQAGRFEFDGGRSGAAIAVDSGSNVFVSDLGPFSAGDFQPSNNRIQQFSSGGVLLNGFNGHEDGLQGRIGSIAVDSSSRIYTAAGTYPAVETTSAPVRRYSVQGDFSGLIAPTVLSQVGLIAVDSSSNNVFAVRRNPDLPTEWQIAELDSDGVLLDVYASGIPFFESWNYWTGGMAPNSTSGRVYLSDVVGDRILAIGEVASPPSATISPASDITEDAATLHGLVNPNGDGGAALSTRYRFEYRAKGETAWKRAPESDVDVGTGTDDVAVSAEVSDLDPNESYEVRLVATRELGGGSATSSIASFTSSPFAPLVSLVAPSRVTDTTARLGGAIVAENSPTTYYFEYGPTSAYGTVAPAGGNGDAGEALEKVGVSEPLSGLQPDTTYHFRLVATNQAGTATSDDFTFTTRTTAEMVWGERGIELVSSPDNGNQNVQIGKISPDGNRVAWTVAGGGPGTNTGAAGSGLVPTSILTATRTSTGWRSQDLLPPADQQLYYGGYSPLKQTPDFSRAVYAVGDPSKGPTGPDREHLVRANSVTYEQELLATVPAGVDDIGVTSDAAHVLATTTEPIDPEHLPETRNLYDFGSGTPELISRMPDGSVPQCGVTKFEKAPPAPEGGGGAEYDGRWFSLLDASWVYFTSSGHSCGEPDQLYVRDRNSGETTLISGPVVSGPEQTPHLLGASEDGSSAVYYTEAVLLEEDTDSSTDFYRWSDGTGNECLTCDDPEIQAVSVASVSQDLSHVYFTACGGDWESLCPLYVWRAGEVRHIGQVTRYLGALQNGTKVLGGAAMSRDGSVLTFYQAKIEGFTAQSAGICGDTLCTQLYRYDDTTGYIECVSCLEKGVPKGKAEEPVGAALVWAMSSDGSTIAFTSSSAHVRGDVNMSPDVYEWHNGSVRLVTDGVTDYDEDSHGAPTVAGISASGADIVFTMSDQETGHEVSHTVHAYDARIGGGFPVPTPPAHCSEESCQGPLQAPPHLALPGSQTFEGSGSTSARQKAQQRKKQRKKRQRVRHRRGQQSRAAQRNG